MKKLFFIAFALMFSFTSAFAGDDHQTRELNRNEEPDAGGGGGGTARETYVVVYRGWCGKARYQVIYDHEPSWWDNLINKWYADNTCDIMQNPF